MNQIATNRLPVMKTALLILLIGQLCVNSMHAQEKAKGQQQPLFQSEDMLYLEMEADFKEVFSNHDDSTEYPAKFTVIDNDGQGKTVEIQIRTRGNTRRESDVCLFAPLRLNFPKKEMKNTVFEGQNILKLVTHCNKSDMYEQNTIVEYLIYKAFNVLTDSSFRVRPAMIKYIFSEKKADTIQKFAFFIERDKHLAERLNVMELDSEKIHPNHMEPDYTCLMDMFQYMIGNTDYSGYSLHNITLLSDSARINPPFPVPYDFDWSGLVSASYAVPHPLMHTEKVTERVYRGFKKDPEIVYRTIALFNARKEEIYQLFENFGLLEDGRRKKALRYLDEFYYTINHEKLVQREFIDGARVLHN